MTKINDSFFLFFYSFIPFDSFWSFPPFGSVCCLFFWIYLYLNFLSFFFTYLHMPTNNNQAYVDRRSRMEKKLNTSFDASRHSVASN